LLVLRPLWVIHQAKNQAVSRSDAADIIHRTIGILIRGVDERWTPIPGAVVEEATLPMRTGECQRAPTQATQPQAIVVLYHRVELVRDIDEGTAPIGLKR